MKSAYRLPLRIFGRLPIRPVRLRPRTGLISFTFDDIYESAFRVGGRLLAQHNVVGTYYIAGGLTGRDADGQRYHSRELVAEISQAGHEVGSHAYSHVRSADLSALQFREELQRNDEFLDSILHGRSVESFAYPFGSGSLSSKRIASKRFATARGVRPGINVGLADLAELRANALYSRQTDIDVVRSMIERAGHECGWLIFYMHDVTDTPTNWGITPSLLEAVLEMSTASSCRVLPMHEARRAAGIGVNAPGDR